MTTDKRMQPPAARMTDKIRKLLALASDPSAALNEAETAGRQAAKLMAAHDISLADLTEAELKAQWDLTTIYAQGCRPGKKNAKEVPGWIGMIAWGVKIYTRTRCSGVAGQVLFSGPRDDCELAKWLHELLLAGCYKGSNGLPASEANAYRNGYANALQARLKKLAEQRDASDDEDASGTALVKVQDARDKAMVEAFGDDSKGRRGKHTQSYAGYEAGSKAHIPTGRPVGNNSQLRLS